MNELIRGLFKYLLFTTVLACMWFNTGVRSHVTRQMSGRRKPFLADTAHMRFISGMHPSVYHQRLVSTERLIAKLARVGSFAGVRALVDGKCVRAGELLTADLTYVRFSTGVYSHVNAHVAGLCEAGINQLNLMF